MGAAFRIGVISDTHNYLDAAALHYFQGVDHILHAGDIGLPWVLQELEKIAPVTAVAGNTDTASLYPELQIVTLAGKKFLLYHIVDPSRPSEVVRERIAREKPDSVVFGHTHKPFAEEAEGVLYFNPGYAGRQRFDLPRSLAIFTCRERIEYEFKFLT